MLNVDDNDDDDDDDHGGNDVDADDEDDDDLYSADICPCGDTMLTATAKVSKQTTKNKQKKTPQEKRRQSSQLFSIA